MPTELENRLQAVTPTDLTPLVRRLLHYERAEVVDWRYRPVEGGFSGAYGVYRFEGQAQAEDKTLDWSLILKVIAPASGSLEPSDWGYWKREALVYPSGLLNALPDDLVAPRCLGIVEHPEQEIWLWLEAMVEDGDETWPLARYGRAANHLGQFNGAYLAGHPLSTAPWLSSGRLHRWVRLAEATAAELPQISQHPLFAGLLPAQGIERSMQLWAERRRWLAILDQLPRSFCHHDAFRRNLMSRTTREGREQTVLLDWAEAGIGVVGEELVPLFSATLTFVAVDIDKIAELDGIIFEGYMDGLRSAGWHGDSRLVRFGYAATAALQGVAKRAIQWPNLVRRINALPQGQEPPRLLNPGGPVQYAAVQRHLLDLGDEARALMTVPSWL